jgi:hypothetical protein
LARELISTAVAMSAVLPLPARAPALPIEASPRSAAYELARTLAARPPLEELLRSAVSASRELFDADEAALVWSERAAVASSLGHVAFVASAPAGSRPPRRSVTSAVVYCAPIVISGQPFGIVKLTNPNGGRALADADLLLLNEIAADLAAALSDSPAAPAPVSDSPANAFWREGDFWTVAHAGTVSRVKDGKGMRQLAQLLASPGREHHALDLVTSRSPLPRGAQSSNDALLDPQSRREYRARIAALHAEIEQAREHNDAARVARAESEVRFLVAELRHCVGLGGRPRNAASAAERARQNVTRSIRAAIRHLATHNDPLARHLARAVRTGVFCAYEPDPRAPIAWEL